MEFIRELRDVCANIGQERFFSRLSLLDKGGLDVEAQECDDLIIHLLRKRGKLYHLDSKGKLEDTLALERVGRNRRNFSVSEFRESDTETND